MAKKPSVPTPAELKKALSDDYTRWKHIYDFGCSDPFWSDGCNINLVRNHIIYDKRKCEEVLGEKHVLYPDEYYFPLPVELPNNFMAVDRKVGDISCDGRANKTLPYSEVVKFDWSESMCQSQC